MDGKKVLIAEEDRDFAAAMERAFGKRGCTVDKVYDGVQALNAFGETEYDLFVCDGRLSRFSGENAIAEYAARYDSPVIYLPESGFVGVGAFADNFGFAAILFRPFTESDLIRAAEKCFSAREREDVAYGNVVLSFKTGKIFSEIGEERITLTEAELFEKTVAGEKTDEKGYGFTTIYSAALALDRKLEKIGSDLHVKNGIGQRS
ncbi:MAG TPA: hypothetical protein DDW54_02950 [Clostridiales bacterium]|nr:hypothetical protein [Clostridiales bacterium]